MPGCSFWETQGEHQKGIAALNQALGPGPRSPGMKGWSEISRVLKTNPALAKNESVKVLLRETFLRDRLALLEMYVEVACALRHRSHTPLAFFFYHPSPTITRDNVGLPVKNLWWHVCAATGRAQLRPYQFEAFSASRRDTAICDDLFPSDPAVPACSPAALHSKDVLNAALQAISLRICTTLLFGGT